MLNADGSPSDAFTTFLAPVTVPTGSMVFWPSPNIPDGWLLANGQEVSRTTYDTLFGVVGTNWGAASSISNFLLPDMRGAVPAGSNGSSFPFGTRVGAETITLTTAQLAAHTHNVKAQGLDNALSPVGYFGAAGPDTTVSTTFATESAGGGTAHDNIQPSVAAYWIIKT